MIREYDVAYFMISVDTLEDNTAFAKKENADFPILADPTEETARKYGVLADYSKFMLGEVANRWTFYIGPDGQNPGYRQEGESRATRAPTSWLT